MVFDGFSLTILKDMHVTLIKQREDIEMIAAIWTTALLITLIVVVI